MQEATRRAVTDPGPTVRGWCPTAWRPMMAGDGLLVRVRPPLGRMSRPQTLALCDVALRHGNGHIDLTNRAALQIRGVPQSEHRALVETLVAQRLIASDPSREARPPVIVNPDWAPGDISETIARALIARLHEFPALPAKIGFAIDAGPAPSLADIPADFRIERGESGGLILRADGRDRGVPIHEETAIDALLGFAHWFVASGGEQSGRVARHKAPLPAAPTERPAVPRSRAVALAAAPGPFRGAYFGRVEAATLAGMLDDDTHFIRLTPWRGLILEGSHAPADDPADPLLAVNACPGAPACPQGSVATRDLAMRLAPYALGLHVSGCAKGCAHPGQAPIVLSGREGRFDFARDARAGAPPTHSGLDPDQILALFGAC